MTNTQKEKELERVVDKCRSRKVVDLLNWLGREAIAVPRHRAGWREVYQGAVDPTLPLEKIHDKDETTVKNRAHRARKYIDDFYATEGVENDIWIDFPVNLAEEERVGKKGGYGIRFRTGPRAVRLEQKRPAKLRLRPAAELWDEMITNLKPRHTLLIYPADPVVKYRKGPDGLVEYEDDRGLESGSGEVAASFMVGATISHLRSMFDIRRSCDVNVSELEVPNSCFIYLGSSMKCKLLQSLRDREPWRSLQSFHFFEAKTSRGKIGSVREGRLGKGKPKHVYRYKDVRLRDLEIDYALISFFKNPVQGQSIVAIQGISTIGTWAAAQFITTDACVKQLRNEFTSRFSIGPNDALPSFELLLEVTVRDYRPISTAISDLKIH